MGEIRTRFLAVFLTSFNFGTPGCDFRNKFKNSYLQNVSLGKEESLGVGSIGDNCFGLVHLLEDAVLNAGDLKLCVGLSVLVMSSLFWSSD